MRYYRTRKPAWELKAGDLIESEFNDVSVTETVKGVRRFLFTGEFEGADYQQAPMTRIEFAEPDGMFTLEPGDREFTVWRPKGKVPA